MDLFSILVVALLLLIVVAVGFLMRGTEKEYKHEQLYFKDPRREGEEQPFPSTKDAPTVYMSMIVPAYNEESRISVMLDETIDYCQKRQEQEPEFTWEIVVVDDGSRDNTAQLVQDKYVTPFGTDRIRLNKLVKNVGKGGAVRRGMLVARGEFMLMVDADGATQFLDLERLEKAIKKNGNSEFGIAIGSRHSGDQDAQQDRAWYRNITQFVFHLVVDTFCVKGIKDTQCGFKLFSRSAAFSLFHDMHIERWAFDAELLYLAQKKKFPISEVAVNWHEVDGSHLSVMSASLQMFKDIVRIPLLYNLGLWKMSKN